MTANAAAWQSRANNRSPICQRVENASEGRETRAWSTGVVMGPRRLNNHWLLDQLKPLFGPFDESLRQLRVMQSFTELLAVVRAPLEEVADHLPLAAGIVGVTNAPRRAGDWVRLLAWGVGDRIAQIVGDLGE